MQYGSLSMFRHKIYMHGFYVSDESGTYFGAYSLTYTQILGMNANIGYERKKIGIIRYNYANIGYDYVYDRKSGYSKYN